MSIATQRIGLMSFPGFFVVFNQPMSGATDGWNGFTLRVVIPNAQLSSVPASPTELRATVEAVTSDLELSSLWVGHQAGAGDAYDAASLTEVQFSGGSGCSVTAGNTLASDTVSFAYDGSSALVFSMHFDGGSGADHAGRRNSVTGVEQYYDGGVNEASTANVTGYTTGTAGQLLVISRIEMR